MHEKYRKFLSAGEQAARGAPPGVRACSQKYLGSRRILTSLSNDRSGGFSITGRGKTKTGYLWAMARDDRPWGGGDPPGVVFTYAPGRAGAHADRLLTGFDGVLQVDGYAGDHEGGPPPVAEEALRRIARFTPSRPRFAAAARMNAEPPARRARSRWSTRSAPGCAPRRSGCPAPARWARPSATSSRAGSRSASSSRTAGWSWTRTGSRTLSGPMP